MAFIAAITWPVADFFAGRDLNASWAPWVNLAIQLTTYSVVAYLAAKVHALLENEHARATHDPLTELQNRRAFLEAGNAEVGRSKRYSHSMAVIFLDLDQFKQLNDKRGHEVGDQALKATAAAILSASRSTDLVARLGGDEFAILFPEIRYSAAVSTGRKIHTAVNHALASFPPVSASVGVAWFAHVDRSFAGMLTAADELMYEVKKEGGNGILAKRLSRTGEPDSQMRTPSRTTLVRMTVCAPDQTGRCGPSPPSETITPQPRVSNKSTR